MNHFHQARIEADLTSRVSEALAAESMDGIAVDVNQRGRDVLLKGEPGSDIERDRALEVAQGVYGVNRVDFAGDASGDVADTGQDAAAEDTKAVDSADDAGTDSDAKAAETADAGGDTTTETGTAEDASADKAADQAAAATDKLPAELTMKMDGEQLVLDGKMASQQQIDALQNEAALQVGVTNVVNNLTVSEEHAEAGWLGSVAKMISALPAGSEMKIQEDTLQLSGDVADDAALEKLSAQMDQMAQGAGLQLQNQLQVAAQSAEPDAGQQNPDQQAARAEECQGRLNAAMQDKRILFTFNDAGITAESNALLDDLAQIIRECSDDMDGMVIEIGGHTDSVGNDAYNLDLSQRRANSVRDYLQGKQIDAALLEAKGFGEANPVASNNTAEGQARNRRITFEIKQK
ncbi:MAG: OmpA family protein [Thiolinea sp.]